MRESLAAGIERPLLERALAAWLHYLDRERSDAGVPLVISDPGAAPLSTHLHQAGSESEAVALALSHAPVFGAEPWPRAFAARLASHLSALRRGGMAALLAR